MYTIVRIRPMRLERGEAKREEMEAMREVVKKRLPRAEGETWCVVVKKKVSQDLGKR